MSVNKENKTMADMINTNTTEYYIDADNLSIEEVLAFGYEEWLKENGQN